MLPSFKAPASASPNREAPATLTTAAGAARNQEAITKSRVDAVAAPSREVLASPTAAVSGTPNREGLATPGAEAAAVPNREVLPSPITVPSATPSREALASPTTAVSATSNREALATPGAEAGAVSNRETLPGASPEAVALAKREPMATLENEAIASRDQPMKTPSAANDYLEQLDAAQRFIDRNDSPAALNAYLELIERYPDRPAARQSLDNLLTDLSKNEPTLESYTRMKPDLVRAAEQGFLPAMLIVARSSQETDRATALKWYQAAASKGSVEAMKRAGDLLYSNHPTTISRP
jgi:TPR repeat protein